MLGGVSGVLALSGFLWSFLILPDKVNGHGQELVKHTGEIAALQSLPMRVEAVEKSDAHQAQQIEAIQTDNIQRREMLATCLAMVTQINERTKRMEDVILGKK